MNLQFAQHRPASEAMNGIWLRNSLELCVDKLMTSFPRPAQLSSIERCGIIARYGEVLEGNFIYWMTACFLAANSDTARAIIRENLLEEVRDCHPGMLRKFVCAAGVTLNDAHIAVVEPNLTKVRLFVSHLLPTPMIAMMAFFEMFIQRFMPMLAELAALQDSVEREYTDVHGTCDVIHSQELVRALEAEIAFEAPSHNAYASLLDGVYLLRALIRDIVFGPGNCEAGN